MSVLITGCGSASNSAQLHLPSREAPSCSASVQSATLMLGVGPADSTGKSVVTCWPGGTRSRGASVLRRDLNPREMGVSSIVGAFVASSAQFTSNQTIHQTQSVAY